MLDPLWHFPLQARHWVLAVFVASALHAHWRGKVRFGLVRALTDFTVLLAPLNSLMVLFSKVGTTPYLDAAQFPELAVLQRNWRVLRDEALQLDQQGRIQAATGHNDLGFNSFFRTGWTRFHLTWYGCELPSAQVACPRTLALLRQLPTVKAAMFASLPPGATLVRHRDPYAGSLRYHLGLVTPNDPACFIDVDGERHVWRDGEVVVFDETYIHHAENHTQHPRIIFFADIERPVHTRLMQALNRGFGRLVMTAAASQNQVHEPVGALNVVFHHVYQLRLKAKALKARSRSTYYLGKWALIGLALWAVFW